MNIELRPLVDVLATLLLDPRTGVLIVALVLAAWSDVKTNRIPNGLVFSGAALALLYSALTPTRGVDLPWSLLGLTAGLLLLLPFYLMRVLGAGDVKLMAMTGAFVGVPNIFAVALASFLAGGVLSVVVAQRQGMLRRALSNAVLIFAGGPRPTTTVAAGSVGKLPYGVAIAAGTIGYLVARQFGFID